MPRATLGGMEWTNYVATASDGTVLSIARRGGSEVQVLLAEGAWAPRPQLLPRFQDPDYYAEVPLAAAQHAAETLGIRWPA